MNRYSKILHHITPSDMRNTHAKKLAAKKIQEDEVKYIKDQLEILKFDWRSSLNEKMGTGDVFAYSADAQPDVDLTVVDATLDASFGIHPDGVADFGYSANGLQGGTVIRDSGTGTGSNGGFDIGKHLAFTGDGYYNVRWAALNPIDSSALDTIVITAIRGNDVNGGEDPDAEYEDLEVWYRTKDMAHNGMRGINITPDGTTVSGVERKIIPIGSDSSGLRDWSLELPAHVRTPGTQFFLVQSSSSGAQFDHYGVTEIKFRRNTPLNVVVPLDSPEAISFVRVGSNEGDPKKRKKKVEDQLKASKEYTDFVMGKDFPGMGATLDDTEQSPIGKDQVAGSFKKAGTPQKTIQQFLQTDDITGEPIEKKIEKSFSQFAPEVTPDGEPAPDPIPVNNNKNIVLGQDAQALETSADEDPAQREAEKEAEKEVAQAEKEAEKEAAQVEKEVEEIEKETELTDDEKQGKSEEEIKAAEEEKKVKGFEDYVYKESENLFLAALSDMQYAAFDVKGALNPLNILQNLITTAMDGLAKYMFGTVAGLLAKIPGNNWAKIAHEAYTGTDWGKMSNNITIARSVMSGKVVSHVPQQMEIRDFANQLTPEWFTKGHRSYVPISDIRHEYADEHIYVERVDGRAVVRSNKGGVWGDVTGKTYGPLDNAGNPAGGIGGHGSGYAQLIIPPDGSSPYVHYYDYNYHNLNNPYDLPVGTTGGDYSSVASDVAHLFAMLARLPHGGIQRAAATASDNFKKQFENLGNTDSFIGEGWPPGIHGAALTDFKVNLNELPKETQDMINAHPLSWTEERISKMTDDQVWDQLSFETAEDVKWFDDNYMELMKKYHPDMFTNNEKYKEVSEKLNDITKQPEYSAAGDAAREYVETVKENYKELIANVEKEIPLPKGDYPEWDPTSDSDLQAQKTVTTKAWSTYQQKWTAAEPAMKAYDAYAATLEKRGNYLYGTSAQIMKLKSLESKMNSLLDVWDKASDAWNASLEAEGKFFDLYVKKLTKERKPWDEVYEKQMAAEDKLADERDEKVKVAQKAYEDTFSVRKGQGGKLLNGGDWTHPETGEVIPGMGTVRSGLETERDQLGELMRAEERAYGITLMKEQKDWIWKTRFSEHGDGKSWNPKGGSGGSGKGKPKPQNKYDKRRSELSLDEPIVRDNQQNSYKPRGSFMQETTFGRIKKMRKKFDYEGKPSPDGFPDNDPPELDPKTGMHPRYGKNSSRYKKLDPVSARSMPKTGDPETDAEVAKAAKKPK